MKKVIGISGINATDNPGPGCGIARSLSEISPRSSVIGLSYDVNDPGNYLLGLFDNTFLLPYPNRGWESLKSSLVEIRSKSGLNFLIPSLDVEMPLMIKYQNDLAAIGVGTFLPNEEQFNLRSKDVLPSLAKQIGCLCPETKVVHSIDDMVEFLKKKNDFPVIVKGKYYSAYVVYSIEAAIIRATEIAAIWGFPLLIQEKIEGQEINVIGLSNNDGQLRAKVSIKKQLTTQLNKIWTAITIRNEDLDKVCDNFTRETKWRGPFELECMINQNGIYLIEINPRFPSWSYFATALGINLPQMLLQIHDSGDCDTRFDYAAGKFFLRYPSEFVTDLTEFQNLISHQNRNGS